MTRSVRRTASPYEDRNVTYCCDTTASPRSTKNNDPTTAIHLRSDDRSLPGSRASTSPSTGT